ncbi:MAG: endonuclease MutS2 [Rhodothermia bacterium]|nr:MAG: endonuclease MutS2 [Rhodothermia bacterium]
MNLSPDGAADKIGLSRVRARLVELTESEPAALRAARLSISSDSQKVGKDLEVIGELQGCLAFDDPIPFTPNADLSPILDLARPEGATLNTDLILEVYHAERTTRLLHFFLDARSEKFPAVASRWSSLEPDKGFESSIVKVFDDAGQVRDDASPELRRIRRDLLKTRQNLRNRIAAALSSAVADGVAADEQPTIRSGRMVIPVLSSAKKRVNGFVHDVSSTGQTVYIEPQDCFDLNNQIRELESAETREIDEIRKLLTGFIRERSGSISSNGELLIQFDLSLAIARLGNELDASVPQINNTGIVRIVEGRNPELLLVYQAQDRENSIVPLNLEIGDSFHTLVISGPNAGGKSVAMKSIGLMTAMLGMGMPVPVKPDSTFCLFDEILVDIGDEQSVDDDLSTYSSHLENLKVMLKDAGENTLVLIDEAGTGTDPDEGSALARAVLESLTARKTRTVVTTHHGSLKVFANDSEGVENGSMSFDVNTLKPTFEFRQHVPGASYATEIATKVGLPDDVIRRARELVGTERVQLEALISSLEESNRVLDARINETEATLHQADKDREQLTARILSLQEGREQIRKRAIEEADQIVRDANRVVEKVVREIRESQAESGRTREARADLEKARHQLTGDRVRLERRTKSRTAAKQDTGTPGMSIQRDEGGPLKKGDQVLLDQGQAVGEILSIKGEEATIAFANLQSRVSISRLTKVGEASEQQVVVRQTANSGPILASTSLTRRIDVRGLRVDEAISRVMAHVDRASAASLDRIEILHGKGTGALREAIQDFLPTLDSVSKIEQAPWNEGGAGVTFVFLDA